MAKKRLEDMNLIDRFLFEQTMEYKVAYESFMSIILQEDVRFTDNPRTEKNFGISPEFRGVRFDVLAEDKEGKKYHTEMQKQNTGNLVKRSRYYQAHMDVSMMEPGEKDFNILKSTCMVIVAPFDIFKKGLYRYTFEGVCRECPELKLEDGALRIFINTRGKNAEDFSEEFLELMEYIEKSTDEVAERVKSRKVKKIHECVIKVKTTAFMNIRYLHWLEMISDAEDEGLESGLKRGLKRGLEKGMEKGMERGRKEGRKEGRAEGELSKLLKQVITKMKKNHSPERIAEALEEDVEYIRTVCEIAKRYDLEYGFNEMIEEIKKF